MQRNAPSRYNSLFSWPVAHFQMLHRREKKKKKINVTPAIVEASREKSRYSPSWEREKHRKLFCRCTCKWYKMIVKLIYTLILQYILRRVNPINIKTLACPQGFSIKLYRFFVSVNLIRPISSMAFWNFIFLETQEIIWMYRDMILSKMILFIIASSWNKSLKKEYFDIFDIFILKV